MDRFTCSCGKHYQTWNKPPFQVVKEVTFADSNLFIAKCEIHGIKTVAGTPCPRCLENERECPKCHAIYSMSGPEGECSCPKDEIEQIRREYHYGTGGLLINVIPVDKVKEWNAIHTLFKEIDGLRTKVKTGDVVAVELAKEIDRLRHQYGIDK